MKKWITSALLAIVMMDAHAANVIKPNSLVITDMRTVEEGYAVPTIVGIATNQSGGAISNAFIKFNLLDAQGNLVGNTIAMASNLAPGQVWHFKAPMAEQGVVSVKVVEVNVYRD
jgi:hypothetical protein